LYLETQTGLQVQSILASGGLVDDQLALNMVLHFLNECKNEHVMLDGFPRTLVQARLLDSNLFSIKRKLDAVLNLDVPESVIINRIEGRWIHEPSVSNSKVLHLYFK
jgi:adenylate kinase family enzyme